MFYAPVLIATLNRYEHFKNCLESLEQCHMSDKTDVYVALDYPAKVEHWEGYNAINDFLKIKEANNKFSKLIVIRRPYNFGIKGDCSNMGILKKYVLSMYDRCISSEDDNIFSPNFLAYMNKGLELFKNDKTVLAINGYRHAYPVKFEKNTFFRQRVDFSAWGYGIWRDRYYKCSNIDRTYFNKQYSFIKLLKLAFRYGCNRACEFYKLSHAPESKMRITDSVLSVYMQLEEMDVVMPTISTVKNIGLDGSGSSVRSIEFLERYVKDQPTLYHSDADFIYSGNGYLYYDDNIRIYKNNSIGKMSWSALVGVLMRGYYNEIKRLFCKI